MTDNKDDRLTQFERALDPTITKFAPKKPAEESIDALVERVRASCKAITELCDDLDAAIKDSEQHARKAADSLMDMIKRVK